MDNRKLKWEYGKELVKVIIDSFNDYGLNFKWSAGWINSNPNWPIEFTEEVSAINPVETFDDIEWNKDYIDICLFASFGDNSIVSEIIESDEVTFENFITQTVEGYITNNKTLSARLDWVSVSIMLKGKLYAGQSYPGIRITMQIKTEG